VATSKAWDLGVEMRRVLPVAGAGLVLALGAATPALALGSRSVINLSATPAGGGGQVSVTATVSSADAHPVSDAKLVTLAFGGQTRSLIDMRPSGEPGRYVGSTTLAPGPWQITVRSIGTAADPNEAVGTASTSLEIAAPPAPASPDGSSPVALEVAAGVGGTALLVGLGLAWSVRRRRSPLSAVAPEPAAQPTASV
jgi:hypothetical protein